MILNAIISPAPAKLQIEFSNHKSTTATNPMINPPSADTPRPKYEIPPFVPLGTGCNVRISSGRELDRMPSSEASVSARQVEKCLLSDVV